MLVRPQPQSFIFFLVSSKYFPASFFKSLSHSSGPGLNAAISCKTFFQRMANRSSVLTSSLFMPLNTSSAAGQQQCAPSGILVNRASNSSKTAPSTFPAGLVHCLAFGPLLGGFPYTCRGAISTAALVSSRAAIGRDVEILQAVGTARNKSSSVIGSIPCGVKNQFLFILISAMPVACT